MMKEQRWEFRYSVPTAEGSWNEKVYYPKSEETRAKAFDKCKELGYKVISCKKLYPFNVMKNQHNFDLIANVCYNRLHDDVDLSTKEFERLEHLREKAEEFFCLFGPIAWLPWEDWKEAKEIAMMAVTHREQACIANGRLDLLQYCD